MRKEKQAACYSIFSLQQVNWKNLTLYKNNFIFAIFLTLNKNSEQWFSLSRFLWEVTNGSLWCIGTVVSPRTGAIYFVVVEWLWTAFLFLIKKKKKCQTCLIYFSAPPQQAIHNLSSQQHSRSCALCPTFFTAWFHDVYCQIKSGKVRAKNGENEMMSKWDGIHGMSSTHTQVHRNASLKNLGCRGAELQFLK